MYDTEKYELIGNIISMLHSSEFDSTLEKIASTCNIPIEYMRRTFIALIRNRILQSMLYITEEQSDNDNSSFIEQYLTSPKKVEAEILEGLYDYVSWGIDLGILSSEEELLILTHIEYGALKALGENVLSIKRAALFEKKDITTPLSQNVKKNREIIIEAKERKHRISFRYQKADGQKEQVECFPSDIISNVSDNWIYLISETGKRYRLDRIINTCKELTSTDATVSRPEPNRKYAWGSYYNDTLKPEHVVLRIASETTNIIQKIKNDTEYRSETSKFYQRGDYYYYEDDVIGLPEFQRWLRSYGSSILVIEPEHLKNDIIQRAHEALQNYADSSSWNNL